MSSYLIKQFIKGIALRGEAANITENVEGSLFHNSTDQKIKSYIQGAVREVITESQIQTLTNKTINAADNLIVVDSANPNLTSNELNLALTELQNDIDSNSSNLASHIAAADPHPQYETAAESQAKVDAHANRVDNPHSVTKTQIGLSNVDNTSDASKPISTATQNALDLKYNASNPSGYVNAIEAAAAAPVQSVAGKVGVVTLTKSDLGLSNVDNTSDANKPISIATQAALNGKIDSFKIGSANGVASLDVTGKVPASQLPSYVDDVVEVSEYSTLPPIGESGKAYVTLDDNKVYRWSGSVYIEISPSVGSAWGSITGTLSNQTDLQSALNSKASIAHNHVSSDITDFNESVDDRVSSLIVAGTNISTNYDDLANTLTISSTVSVITDHAALTNIGTNSHATIDSHIASTSNPHNVTKSQVGLGNVDNTSDLDKPVSTATQSALDGKQNLLGFTPENISNKSTDTNLGTSDALYPTQNAVKTYVDNSVSSSSTPDATPTVKGILKLSGDLSGTADSPTVPGLSTKEPLITAGTTSQYFRGDKTFQTLDKNAVGLSNVDNTSDANKPISTATQSALDGKANSVHTHVATDITDLSEAIDDRISTTIVAGSNVTVSYDDLANTLTISAAGGGSGGATTLDELTDVSVPSPANGQALVYNTSTSQWEAQTISSGSGGATELNGLNDVTLSGTLDNQILRYDLASTQWKNETLLKDDIGLSNVDNTSDLNKPISTATQSALDGKANSVHTHVSTDITDFSESVDDRVSSLLVAGSNITLTYDDLANTLSIAAATPDTSSAERLITNVFNDTGATIPKMSAVYINGSQGDQAKIVLAQANTESTSSKTYGLVQSDLPATESGVVVEQGRLTNLNTDVAEWTEGDVLWLSSTVAGGITNVKPSAPNHAVFIGYLIKKHQSVGVIQVSIQNGYELQELHNVAINGISDGQVLKYESSTSLWKNQTLTKSDVGLSNVDNTSDLNKPISTATQSALDGKANSVHTHVAADITDFNAAVDARIPVIPAAVTSVNGDSGPDVVLDSDDIQEGTSNLYFSNERVDDRVNDLLVAGSGISLSYNDSANTLTITATGGGSGGTTKYVRGFTFSGAVTAGTSGVPVIITSAATINKIKTYGVGISGTWTFDLYKNGSGTPFQSLAISASSVVSVTSTEGVLENDVITCVVNSVGSAGNDFSITLELS